MLWSAPAKRVRCSREPLEAIPHSGPMPDAQCLERGVLPQRALPLLETLLRQGLLPVVIPYSALISACGKGRQPQGALQSLLHLGLLPVITYSVAISACEKGRNTLPGAASVAGDATPRPPA